MIFWALPIVVLMAFVCFAPREDDEDEDEDDEDLLN
jgi:hypothetical protein